jgi:hypothetical protein
MFAHAFGHTVRPAAHVMQVVGLTHAAPGAHWVLLVQLVAQAVPEQTKVLQDCMDTGGQAPAPLHAAAKIAVPFAQEASRQEVVEPGKTQAVAVPLQNPAHGAVPVQAACPARGGPDTGAQVPASDVETLQYSHEPVHRLLQQTPSTHMLLMHSPGVRHVWPLAFLGVQVPPTQKLLTQSALVVQAAGKHAVPEDAHTTPPLQAKVLVGVTHVPAPWQVGAALSWALTHEGLPHVVLAGVK